MDLDRAASEKASVELNTQPGQATICLGNRPSGLFQRVLFHHS